MFAAKATVDKEGNRITFEGTEDFVTSQLDHFTNAPRKSIASLSESTRYNHVTAAALVDEKEPKGHHELVVVFAFSLAENGVAEFTEEDIKRLYLQARVRPPKVIGQALRDAKNKFDYLEAGEQRGSYRLSAHGDRTVRYDLPRSRT